MPLIELAAVGHSYGTGATARVVLRDLDLRLAQQRIGVIGANGSGKSTFARLLNVVLLTNPRKAGDNYVTGAPGAVAGQVAGQVRAGALEDSGADATTSIVDMMQSMRAYESGQKVIQAIDDTLGKAASSVASVSG